MTLARSLAVLLLAAVLVPLAAVAWRGSGLAFGPSDWAAVRFTILQAVVSAALATGLAIPVARAIARRSFPGRGLLITLLGAPFLLPAVVAVLGLLAVFGRSGIVNQTLQASGLPPVSIFGMQGVILVHVFLNLPLAIRMILHGWLAIPQERVRLAQSLGFRPADIARHLERPMLREVLPGVALIIAVAVRFDFDLGRAAALALVQVVVTGVAAILVLTVAQPSGLGLGLGQEVRLPGPPGWRRVVDIGAIGLAVGFLAVPMLAVVLRGLPGVPTLPVEVLAAAGRSVAVAIASAGLATAVALTLALGAVRGNPMVEIAATLPLATSGLVLGTGLFLLVQPLVTPMTVALPVTVLVNTLLSVPLLYRILVPEARALAADYGRLADSLALAGWARLRWLVLPRLARPLGFGAGIAAALAMGDLGVITLFAGDGQATLPLLIQRLAGAYRLEGALAASVLLVLLSFALYWVCEAGGRRAAA
ncbi:MAG: thiamine/thiamine pyrophosphate ABC transporter permease ThiP [Rhodobacterales bacterium 12-65-15]|nr:MAG: thiamine/thiamine pyrophosphate ABC transporter permease ThiP [Rhodobacterales bacterium 12-65-15]